MSAAVAAPRGSARSRASETLFRGGWVLTLETREPRAPDPLLQEVLTGWRHAGIGPYAVRFDDTWRCSRAAAGDAEVLLLGSAMDLTAPTASQDEAVAALAEALAGSDDAFLDRLDDLVGAHVVFARREGTTWALQDATAMEGLSYDTGSAEPLVASHPALIAELRGYAVSALGDLWRADSANPVAQAWRMWAGPWHLPGVTTAFDEVHALTPNTRLDIASGEVERFFPRAPIGIVDLEAVVEQVATHLRDALAWVAREFAGAASVSLSGGIDSRLTLAASREHAPDLSFFTYYYPRHPGYRHDRRVARTLAERLDLPWAEWPLAAPSRTAAGDRAFRRSHGGIHGRGDVEQAFVERFPAGHLHVRSNVLEVVRGYFVKNRLNRPDEFDAARLSRLFRMASADAFVAQYEEYIAVTDFTVERKLDMHHTDLYHWEQRLGRWHSDLVRRMKLSHNTFIIWNSRRVLKLMLARPLEERADAVVIHRLIERMWPEAHAAPIFSGSRFAAPPRAPGADASSFAWSRVPPEVRTAFGGDPPPPDAMFFLRRARVDAAFEQWLPIDPVADEQVRAALARPAGVAPDDAAVRQALLDALLAAGAVLPPVADAASLRPHLSVRPAERLVPPPLHAYEQRVLVELHRRGREGGVVVVPAGAERRRATARWLLEDVVRSGGRVLWLAPDPELVQQAALDLVGAVGVLHAYRDAVGIRLVGGGFGGDRAASLLDDDHVVALATAAAVAGELEALRPLLAREDLVVVVDDDAPGEDGRAIADAVREGGGTVLGLAADGPSAHLGRGGPPIASVEAAGLHEAGVLGRPTLECVAGGGDAERIVAAWLERHDRGPTVVLARDRAHAVALRQRFAEAGARTAWVARGRPERDGPVRRFRRGEVDVLVAAEPLAPGLDLPVVRTLLVCRPVRGRTHLAELLRGAFSPPPDGVVASRPNVLWFEELSGTSGAFDPKEVIPHDAVGAPADLSEALSPRLLAQRIADDDLRISEGIELIAKAADAVSPLADDEFGGRDRLIAHVISLAASLPRTDAGG